MLGYGPRLRLGPQRDCTDAPNTGFALTIDATGEDDVTYRCRASVICIRRSLTIHCVALPGLT